MMAFTEKHKVPKRPHPGQRSVRAAKAMCLPSQSLQSQAKWGTGTHGAACWGRP